MGKPVVMALIVGSLVPLASCGLLVGVSDLDVAPTTDSGAADQLAVTDAGGRADTQAPVDSGPHCETTPFARGTTAATEAGASKQWETPNGALSADSDQAKIGLGFQQPSPLLEVRGFVFTIPETATVKGIAVRVSRSSTHRIIKDAAITLIGAGRVGDAKKDPNGWPAAVAPQDYGGAEDAWGAALTPAMVNDAAFGVGISAFLDLAGGVVSPPPGAFVDEVRVAVTYCQ
jgi:hypothetical protein